MSAGDTKLSDLATTGFKVSYDAGTGTYSIALPSFGGAPASTFEEFAVFPSDNGFHNGQIKGPGTASSDVAILDGLYQYTNRAQSTFK